MAQVWGRRSRGRPFHPPDLESATESDEDSNYDTKCAPETRKKKALNSNIITAINNINNEVNKNIITDAALTELGNLFSIINPSQWNAENRLNALVLISEKMETNKALNEETKLMVRKFLKKIQPVQAKAAPKGNINIVEKKRKSDTANDIDTVNPRLSYVVKLWTMANETKNLDGYQLLVQELETIRKLGIFGPY